MDSDAAAPPAEPPAQLSLDALMIGAPKRLRDAVRNSGIPVEKLRELTRVSDARSAFDVLVGLAWVVSVPLLYWLLPHPLMALVCIPLAIHNFNYLAQIVHESDHNTLFRDDRVNGFFGNLCAYIIGYNRKGHGLSHMQHHLYLNTDRDPDQIWSRPGDTGRQVLYKLLEDLFFVSAVKRFLQYFQSDRRTYRVDPWKGGMPLRSLLHGAASLAPIALMQSLLLMFYWSTIGAGFYILFHVLPLFTLYPVQIRIRSIAEHGYYDAYVGDPGDEAWISRTSRLSLLERFVIGPMGQNLHYEHHLFPGMPHYGLRAVHRLMKDAGLEIPSHPSYVAFTFRKVWNDLRRPPPPAPEAGA